MLLRGGARARCGDVSWIHALLERAARLRGRNARRTTQPARAAYDDSSVYGRCRDLARDAGGVEARPIVTMAGDGVPNQDIAMRWASPGQPFNCGENVFWRCGFRGCPNLTTERYCPEHQRLARAISDRKRGTTKERGYDGDWERLAEQRRELDAYLCQRCLQEQRVTPSNLVDHIYPIHIRPDWRLEILNTQVLCRACHTRKTSEDNRLYGGPSSTPTREQQANRLAAKQINTAPRASTVNDIAINTEQTIN